MARALETDDLYRIRLPADPQLSPDGRRVAYVVRQAVREKDDYESSIWVADTDGGSPPRRLTQGEADGAPRWSPAGDRLAFVSKRGDDAAAQIYLLPVDGGEATRLTQLPLGAGEPSWSPDGRTIAYVGAQDARGVVDPADADAAKKRAAEPLVITRLNWKFDGVGFTMHLRRHLFVVPADGGEPRQLTEGDASVSTFCWSPDGSHIAFSAPADPDDDADPTEQVHVLEVASGERRTLTAAPSSLLPVRWSPDGAGVLVAGQRVQRAGHSRLFVLSLDGSLEDVTDLDRNVMLGGPAYPGGLPAFAGDDVLFCARERGRVHVFAAAVGGQARPVVDGDERVVAGISVAADRLAFIAATAGTPGEVHVAATDGSDERVLTSLWAESCPDVELVAPVERTFRARDGGAVPGWLLRAGTSDGPRPLLLDVHGGPHNAFGPAFDGYHLHHQVLAAAGWAVLFVNPRGSDGYGEEFYRGVIGGWGIADEGDFHGAIDALVEEGVADPGRLAVTGYSYGGFMTCWLTARSDRFAAAVTGGCVTDLTSMAGTSDFGIVMGRHEFCAMAYEDPKRYQEMSPISYVGDVTTPTLVLHGERDDRCPVGQAEQWFAALRARGIETELVRYPDGSHLFIVEGRPSHRIDYSNRLIDWVTRHPAAPA